ncbi:MAG TPA: FIST N-terminal domain-containing protein [bacterium]|nr:FIST N-terminal domain-containing protein [bacterium]
MNELEPARPVRAAAAIGRGAVWEDAAAAALSSIARQLDGGEADVAFLFASSEYLRDFPALLARVRGALPTRVLAGCSGQAVIGGGRELEGEPAVALLAVSLPGASWHAAWITQSDLELARGAAGWHERTGVPAGQARAWFLFADPFSVDGDALLEAISGAYPGVPVVGGLASGDYRLQRTQLFLNDRVYERGAVALALGGAYTLRTVVSQGCTPIGEPWIITAAAGQIVEAIAGRPAYKVLLETVTALPPEVRARARGNLFVGLVVDERRETLRRGDFLIRNLIGVDPDRGAIVVGAQPRAGQTLQFQIRDRAAADEDLAALLDGAHSGLGSAAPVAGLLCVCNGRGAGLFGSPDHDAAAVAGRFGSLPLAGFFCNGEFGPVGPRNFVHGYTASLALIVPDAPDGIHPS